MFTFIMVSRVFMLLSENILYIYTSSTGSTSSTISTSNTSCTNSIGSPRRTSSTSSTSSSPLNNNVVVLPVEEGSKQETGG